MNNNKRYIFDLDKPPQDRWTAILIAHKDIMPSLKKTIDHIYASIGLNGITGMVLKKMISLYTSRIMHYEELQSISAYTKIDFEKILLMQLIYEMSSACTTFICKIDNRDVMFRTMDWDMKILKDLTIELEFVRNGKTLFIAPGWVGCVGLFTVYDCNQYSIAINYRRTPNASMNLMSVISNLKKILSMTWPVSYFVRKICEDQLPYTKVLDLMSQTHFVSPCYITLYNPSEISYVLTRDADKLVTQRNNSKNKYLVQTNADYYPQIVDPSTLNIMWSNERYKLISDIMKKNDNQFPNLNSLLIAVYRHPIVNNETIYSCIMTKDYLITNTKFIDLISNVNKVNHQFELNQ